MSFSIPLQHISPFGKSFGPFPHILAQNYDRSLWTGCYSVWLHDPAPFTCPTRSPFLGKDPWVLSREAGFLLNMETIKCWGSTTGASFYIRHLLQKRKSASAMTGLIVEQLQKLVLIQSVVNGFLPFSWQIFLLYLYRISPLKVVLLPRRQGAVKGHILTLFGCSQVLGHWRGGWGGEGTNQTQTTTTTKKNQLKTKPPPKLTPDPPPPKKNQTQITKAPKQLIHTCSVYLQNWVEWAGLNLEQFWKCCVPPVFSWWHYGLLMESLLCHSPGDCLASNWCFLGRYV